MSRKLNTAPRGALVIDEAEETAVAAPARPGIAAWLPHTRRGWVIAGLTALTFVASAVVAGLTLRLTSAQASAPVAQAITGPAIAVDGATITIAGRKLRLEGIEAPPATLVCRDGAWKYRCGDDARRGLETAIGRTGLDCVVGPANQATCHNGQGLDISALQVQNGWAVIDLHRTSRYFAEQARAQQDSRGLWHTDFAQPETWRLAQGDRLF
jgi:endonuclease YncB( thermonuclease family)